MPRGPNQGTYQSGFRPTIATAPDGLVLINGEPDLSGCPKCKRKFDLSNYITSIQVDLNIDSAPGSASVSLSIPRHSVDDFYFEGNPIITPMMEIEIFAKGHFLVEGLPQYYPIFWGLVTEVSDNFSAGEHTVTLQCNDILKWWEICKMNINPAYTAPAGQLGRNLFGNVMFGMNPYDVIYTLSQMAFGDVVLGTGSLTSLYKENSQKATFNSALSDIMLYWQQRFTRIRNNLLLYGVNGVAVRGDSIYDSYRTTGGGKTGPFASSAVRRANGGDSATQMVFDPTDPGVVAFRTQGTQAGQVNLWQSEFQTKLELATSAKEAIGFEFFMDVTGDIVFKPPFYNLDILSNKPVSWIQDIDIIDWNFSESESEVVTQLQIQGNYTGNIDWGMPDDITPNTSVTDYHLLRKYGWRSQQLNSEFMASPLLMFYQGLDTLDRLNARRHRGSITIPIRPELRLGFPIYIAPKDTIWYLTGISHSIQFGSRATTTLTCTARREKFLAPKGIGTLTLTKPNPPSNGGGIPPKDLARNGHFHLDIGEAAMVPAPADLKDTSPYEPLILRHPKTGRLVGYPNVVMVYTRPFAPTPDTLAGIKKPGTNKQVPKTNAAEANQRIRASLDAVINTGLKSEADGLREKYHNNRYSYGLNSAGAFTYAYETKKAINQFLLLPAKNIDTKLANGQNFQIFAGSTGMIRPVSDERGFEVIGHYRYGRGVSLRDGSLVLNEGGANKRANVDTQIALSGGLFETLNAQSQGLTTLTTAYANPAAVVNDLQPEDLQTAGTITPDQKIEFAPAGKNFVDAAPLGSPEQKGVAASVEAGQLSRALTLTEMTVRTDLSSVDESCDCLLGRGDLAFINSGFQVTNNLNGAAPDNTSLFGQQTSAGGAVAGSTTVGDGTITTPVKAASFSDIRSKIEGYLFTLYDALDKPHQEYENSLRGVNLDVSKNEQAPDLFAPPGATSGIAPPFSQGNRAALGDPNAIAAQGSSARADLNQTVQEFGTKLKNNIERAKLNQEIANDQGQVTKLEAKIKQIQAGADANGTLSPEDAQRVQDLSAEVAKLQQEIADDKAKLSQLT